MISSIVRGDKHIVFAPLIRSAVSKQLWPKVHQTPKAWKTLE
jgi:hypothetical protein